MSHVEPNLKALLAFEKAAQTNSVTKAADLLNVSSSAVSRYIAILEHDLGVRLFERRNGRMQITSNGLQFYQSVHQALETIRRSARQISNKDANAVRIWCYPTFANEWLLPRIEKFQKEVGGRISMVTGTEVPDDLMRHCDLAIVPEENLSPEVSIQFLFEERLVPVCAPSVMNAGDLNFVDVSSLPILCTRYRLKSWSEWSERYVGQRLTQTAIDFDQSGLALRAALEGLGIALAVDAWICISITRGALVLPFGNKSVPGDKIYLAWEHRGRSNPLRARLSEWIQAEMQSCQASLNETFSKMACPAKEIHRVG